MRSLVALASTLLLLGCGTEGTSSPSDAAFDAPAETADSTGTADAPLDVPLGCSVVLSGALSGAFACVASGAWASSTDKCSVGALVSAPSPLVSLQFSIVRNGKLTVGTWKSTDPGASSGWIVKSGTGAQWYIDNEDAGAPGSFTLVITNVSSKGPPTASGETFFVSATLDATLIPVPGSGATGTVTVHANLE